MRLGALASWRREAKPLIAEHGSHYTRAVARLLMYRNLVGLGMFFAAPKEEMNLATKAEIGNHTLMAAGIENRDRSPGRIRSAPKPGAYLRRTATQYTRKGRHT